MPIVFPRRSQHVFDGKLRDLPAEAISMAIRSSEMNPSQDARFNHLLG